jgi:hypothetical protein
MAARGKVFGLCALLFLLALPAFGQSGQPAKPVPSAAKAKTSRPIRFRLAGFSFGAGYGHYSGRYWWPWYGGGFHPYSYYYSYPYRFYSPLWYDAPALWYHPGWYTGFAYRQGMGEIRLRTAPEDAEVYLNDAWAGKTKDLKSIWLEPGAYNLRVQAENYQPFAIRVYVLSGKTLKVDAPLISKEP